MEKFELLYSVLSSLHATKELHRRPLKEIFDEFPRGWQVKINDALKKSGLELPL